VRLAVRSVFGLASLQDGGRVGYRRFGVPVGGAFDRSSMRLANSLMGNDLDAPVVEFALGTMELEALDSGCVAVVGAAEHVLLNGAKRAMNAVVRLRGGDLLTIVPPFRGLRTYIAVSGGFVAERVLGSVSGTVVDRGTELATASDRSFLDALDRTELMSLEARPLRVAVNGDDSWCGAEYRVSRHIDRVGLRLEGPKPMMDARAGRSEPSVFGAVQLTEDRTVIVHGPDGPTIGGYVKIGCVVRADLDRLGQLAPGEAVSFVRKDEG
jgi:allophanate hydrolase subunit 2